MMKTRNYIIFGSFVGLLGICLIGSVEGTGLIVPAYFPWWRKSGINDYDKLVKFSETAEPNKLVVVINPNNGPWKAEWSFTPQMRDFAENIRKNYQHPIGYVYTSYARRPIEEIQQDMRTYMDIYGIKAISGFFLDEVSENAADIDYYKKIIDYGNSLLTARSFCTQNFGIVLNAGTFNNDLNVLNEYGDLLIIREMTEQAFLSDKLPTNLSYPEKSAGLVYSCDNWEVVDNKIRRNGIGYYYCTDRRLDNNPWLALPSHWEESSLMVLGI